MGSLAREQVQNSFHSFRFPVMTQQLSIGTVCPTGLGMCPPRGGLSQCPTPAPPAAQSQVRPPPSCQAPTLRAWPPSRPTPARPPADLPRDLALGRGACLPQALPPVPPWGERGAGGRDGRRGLLGLPSGQGSRTSSPGRIPCSALVSSLWSGWDGFPVPPGEEGPALHAWRPPGRGVRPGWHGAEGEWEGDPRRARGRGAIGCLHTHPRGCTGQPLRVHTWACCCLGPEPG